MLKSTFMYSKKDGEVQKYDVVVLKESGDYLEGFSIKDLSDQERKNLTKIFAEFETKLNPYMKTYRKFSKKDMSRRLDEKEKNY